jgi:hypothetical protein
MQIERADISLGMEYIKAVYEFYGVSDYVTLKDAITRPVYVTPFPGAYGVAGVVITINGSPTRGTTVVFKDGAAPAFLDSHGGPKTLRTKKGTRIYNAAMELAKGPLRSTDHIAWKEEGVEA